MRLRHRSVPLLLLMIACTGKAAEPPVPPASTPSHAAPSGPSPAEMSHGEAKVNDPAVPLHRPAEAPPRSTTHRHAVRMTTSHIRHVIAPGVVYEGWAFDSVIPGPVVRVTVGDTVDFTIVNRGPIPHSMDFHAAEIAPSRAYVNVNPGDSLSFQFVARVPGAFMYHCGTAPVAAHIANGMYGAIVVDPVRPLPTAREFVLVQSEFYLSPAAGADSLHSLDWAQLLDLTPDHVVFNGVAGQYAAHPLAVDPGELVRFYIVNAGPNRVSAFHLVGGIFDRVRVGGFGPPMEGVQTFNVPVGGGVVFEARPAEAGIYPFVSHAFADATKGAVGVLQVGKAGPAMAGGH
ncbi:MAG: multicopper oxidase domain-containing protein [Gemmatimonadales bacterium]